MVIRASGCQIREFSLWKALKPLLSAAISGVFCPKYCADAAFSALEVLEYKPIPRLGRVQGAETVHLDLLCCAKSLEMWRMRTLLLGYGQTTPIASRGGRLIGSVVLAVIWLPTRYAREHPNPSRWTDPGPCLLSSGSRGKGPRHKQGFLWFPALCYAGRSKTQEGRDRFRSPQCGEVQDQERSSCSHLNTGKISIGYYFIGPGKLPHV